MRSPIHLFLIGLAVSLWLAAGAHGATVQTVTLINGAVCATGVTDLEVGGTAYDVDFVVTTYSALPLDAQLPTEQEAASAAAAISSLFNSAGVDRACPSAEPESGGSTLALVTFGNANRRFAIANPTASGPWVDSVQNSPASVSTALYTAFAPRSAPLPASRLKLWLYEYVNRTQSTRPPGQ